MLIVLLVNTRSPLSCLSLLNPDSFVLGVDLEWTTPPPQEVLENEPFTASFSLILHESFYVWAIQNAQNGFKANFFQRVDGTPITRY